MLADHCSNASSREWASLIPLLTARGATACWRLIFVAMGDQDPWPDNRPFDADADVNILKRLLIWQMVPCILLAILMAARWLLKWRAICSAGIRSLTLIEPTVFQLLHETGHRQWSVVTKMARRVQDAVERGEHRSAAYIFTSFWIGRIKWFLLPERHKRAIASTMKKVVLDFEIVDLAHRTPEHYASIKAPVQLIIGTRTRAPAIAVGAAIGGGAAGRQTGLDQGGPYEPVYTQRSDQ